MNPKILFFVAAAALSWTTCASGQSIMLGASSSNTLIQVASSAGSAQLSNGQGDIYVGRTNQDGPGPGPATISIRRGLLAFDVGDNVPAGATITGVTLTLQDVMGRNGNQEISLSRMLRSWGQGASFSTAALARRRPTMTRPGTILFTMRAIPRPAPLGPCPAASRASISAPTVSALSLDSTAATSQTVVWSSTASPAMTTDVQQWLDSPAANFGWIILGNENAGQTAKRFGGQTAATYGETPPALTVQYLRRTSGAEAAETTPGRRQETGPRGLARQAMAQRSCSAVRRPGHHLGPARWTCSRLRRSSAT